MKRVYPVIVDGIREKKLKKQDIADKLKISKGALYQKLQGRASFRVEEAIDLHEFYFPEIPIEELFEKKEV